MCAKCYLRATPLLCCLHHCLCTMSRDTWGHGHALSFITQNPPFKWLTHQEKERTLHDPRGTTKLCYLIGPSKAHGETHFFPYFFNKFWAIRNKKHILEIRYYTGHIHIEKRKEICHEFRWWRHTRKMCGEWIEENWFNENIKWKFDSEDKMFF